MSILEPNQKNSKRNNVQVPVLNSDKNILRRHSHVHRKWAKKLKRKCSRLTSRQNLSEAVDIYKNDLKTASYSIYRYY